MRTEEQNVYLALIVLELVLFIPCPLMSMLHLGFETATTGQFFRTLGNDFYCLTLESRREQLLNRWRLRALRDFHWWCALI